MTPKQRFISAIERKVPDRLPVTTHHIMPYFLDKYMNGINDDEFFNKLGFDPIVWTIPYKSNNSNQWRIEEEQLNDPQYKTTRYTVVTP
jgi:hypothetical protein